MKSVFVLCAIMCIATCATGQPYIGAVGPTYKVTLQNGTNLHKKGLKVPPGWESRKIVNPLPKLRGKLPAKFSWMDKLTPIQDQGNCGSCWAFSAQATMADVLAIHGHGAIDLSEQFLVSCDKESSGCGGGWPTSAFELIKQQGDVLEKDMPYTESNGHCPASVPHTYKLAKWVELSSGVPTAEVIKQAIYTYGPVSVAVSATGDFDNYASGIYNAGTSGVINHAVNIVGWDETVKPYHWIMRNSWGTSWGEKGFMRIAYGSKKIGYAAAYIDVFGPVPHGEPTPNPTVVPTPTIAPTPSPTPTPGPIPCPECKPCTFFRWIATMFNM